MIQLENVGFSYNGEAETLRGINLHIRKGECVLLCGASGCGKTTLTKLINGLVPHFTPGCRCTGSVTVNGMPVDQTPLYRLAESVGSVFQNPKSQFFNVDADSELAFGLENQGTDPDIMRQRLDETVTELDIQRLLHRGIFNMSGGEKQLLAFASVYAMMPEVIVLDEPTANLDDAGIERLQRVIAAMKQRGMTVVIAEHRLFFLRELADRVVYLDNGSIQEIFSGADFFALPEETLIQKGLRSATKAPALFRSAKGGAEKGPCLSIESLGCHIKGHSVFGGLSLKAQPGEVIGITGPNGAGKTTLARCLCGLVKQAAGVVRYEGKPLKPKQRNKLCAMVMQDVNHQLFYDSVWNECESAASVDATQIEEVLTAFDLLGLREAHPMALSGGQKQRLAIACAVLSGKRVLIFDEPTSGLDYRHMLEVSEVIRQLSQQGHILLIVSHDHEFLNRTCTSALWMGGAEEGDKEWTKPGGPLANTDLLPAATPPLWREKTAK